MALITGRDCALKIGEKEYTKSINSFELSFSQSTNEYAVLGQDDPLTYASSVTGNLSITAANDIDVTDGLWRALWDSAGKSIAFVATYKGATLSGKCIAVQPGLTASAGEVSEFSVEMILDGMPVPGTTPAGKGN